MERVPIRPRRWCWASIPTTRAARLGDFSVPKAKLTEMWSGGSKRMGRTAIVTAQRGSL